MTPVHRLFLFKDNFLDSFFVIQCFSQMSRVNENVLILVNNMSIFSKILLEISSSTFVSIPQQIVLKHEMMFKS